MESIGLLMIAYFVGSIPFGLLIAKAYGIDIVALGSRNVGATNIGRIIGEKEAIFCLVLDALKGVLPTYFAWKIGYSETIVILSGLFAIIGHTKSIFLIGEKTSGGKGVSTSLGVIIAFALTGIIDWHVLVYLTVIWWAIFFLSRYVSLSSIVSIIVFPALLYITSSSTLMNLLGMAIAILVVIKHKENMRRLFAGTEEKYKFAKKGGEIMFAFFVIPEDTGDIKRKYPFLEKVPNNIVDWAFKKFFRPRVVGEITGIKARNGRTTCGIYIALPLFPKDCDPNDENYNEERVLPVLLSAARLAKKKGAKILALGGMTAIPGGKGKWLSEHSPIPVTTGNTYTVALAITAAEKVMEKFSLTQHNASIAVVGAQGSIGKAVVIAMEQLGVGNIIEIGRENGHEALIKADIIISATSSPLELEVNPLNIKKGAVIIDVARPRDFPDILHALMLDGGIVKVPGSPMRTLPISGLPQNMAFGCMAEVMILELAEKYTNYTIGSEISLEKVEEMNKLARWLGFAFAEFRRHEKTVSQDEINRIKALRNKELI